MSSALAPSKSVDGFSKAYWSRVLISSVSAMLISLAVRSHNFLRPMAPVRFLDLVFPAGESICGFWGRNKGL